MFNIHISCGMYATNCAHREFPGVLLKQNVTIEYQQIPDHLVGLILNAAAQCF